MASETARATPGPRSGPAPGRPRVRAGGGLVVLLLLLGLVAVRLVQVQVVGAAPVAEAAEEQLQRSADLPAPRGSLLDRAGEPLATSTEAALVEADPSLLEGADEAAAARALAPLLGRDVDAVADDLARDSRYVRLAAALEPTAGQQVRELGLPGVAVTPVLVRDRPEGRLASAVVGFVDHEGAGAGGLELVLDDLLTGEPGRRSALVGPRGHVLPQGERLLREPVPGEDVRLTLDRDLQWVAEDVLRRQVEATGAESGHVVVTDPQTGDVLALAVAPGYDAASPGGADPALRGNAAASDVYEPGSVLKVVTAATALEAGVVGPSTSVDVPDALVVGGKAFTDDHRPEEPRLPFAEVVATSSNVGTIQVAQMLGRERLYEGLRSFGVGVSTDSGLPGESAGLLPRPENWWGTSEGTIPIGHGVSVTALQVAQVMGTVAAGGVRHPLHVVEPGSAPGTSVGDAAAREPVRVVSASTAEELSAMLEAVTVEGGTALRASVPGYRVAGKTGTARRVDPDEGGYGDGYTASFAGFAPVEDPRVVVSVAVHDPQTSIYGGVVAAPIFRDVVAYALPHLGVGPDPAPGDDVEVPAAPEDRSPARDDDTVTAAARR